MFERLWGGTSSFGAFLAFEYHLLGENIGILSTNLILGTIHTCLEPSLAEKE